MLIVANKKVKKDNIEEITNVITNNCEQVYMTEIKGKMVFVCKGEYNKNAMDNIKNDHRIDNIIFKHDEFIFSGKLFQEDRTVIKLGDEEVGNNKIFIMAGPCSVESEEQFRTIARSIKDMGVNCIRGGCFKPRTSPYSFQGLRDNGLEILKRVKKELDINVITEIMSIESMYRYIEDIDIIQIGAKNMFNYELLKEVGKTNKPILLKRSMSASIEEFLLSAEYIMKEGNTNVMLCERGIRTFERFTRNTLDLNAIPVLKRLSHLPVIVDPSHAAGHWWMIEPLAKAAIAAGADGLLIEVHNDPSNALCDGGQSINLKIFKDLIESVKRIAKAEDRLVNF